MYKWELDASRPVEYHSVEAQRGREFIIRMTTGADVFLALQQFAKDHNIRFAKIHAVYNQPSSWCGHRIPRIPITGITKQR